MKAKIHKLLEVTLLINSAGTYYAWFDFSGHVDLISVRITKIEDKFNPVYEGKFYLDHSEARKTCDSIITHLIKEYLIVESNFSNINLKQ